jgi:asparagine synthase (glutamine-hydrolysing)
LNPGPPLELDSDEAYAAAFLDVFTEAVRCRLRSTGKLAAMLSGGLDSSSVVAVAAGIRMTSGEGPLKTLSAVGLDAEQCQETQAVHSALTIAGLDPSIVSQIDVIGHSAALMSEIEQADNPFNVQTTILRLIYLKAKEDGINIVLDGGAGDVVLTSSNRIAAMLRRGQVVRALREVDGEMSFWKPSKPAKYRLHALLSGAWVAFAPLWLRNLRRHALFSKPFSEVRSDLARRVDNARRRRIADAHGSVDVRSDAARRARVIRHPHLSSGRERFDQIAAPFAIECRDPFMDIRVIHFCLSLPPEQLQDGGWPKIILRRAIQALVPHDIAWRSGKEHLGGDFTAALFATAEDWGKSMRDHNSPLQYYVSDAVRRSLGEVEKRDLDALTLRLFALDLFLRRYRARSDGL